MHPTSSSIATPASHLHAPRLAAAVAVPDASREGASGGGRRLCPPGSPGGQPVRRSPAPGEGGAPAGKAYLRTRRPGFGRALA
jgi:hypothetical protein